MLKPLLCLALSLPTLLASPAQLPTHDVAATEYSIPTSYESAVMGRRILALSKLADFSTVFPHNTKGDQEDALDKRPEGLVGLPVNMMDYIADCEDTGNPTLLALRIATTFRNAAAGSNVSVSLRWMPPFPPSRRIPVSLWDRVTGSLFGESSEVDVAKEPRDTVPYSAANLPRMSLMGYLEPIESSGNPGVPGISLAACYTKKHPDAKYWLPGNMIHESYWARLVVTQVYFVGGFGDRAYIGWIPIEEWQAVTTEEWQKIQLPGEKKGWHEWSDGEWEVEL
jgi:hypothetical protein